MERAPLSSGHDYVTRIIHLLALLALNAVPVAGWFGRHDTGRLLVRNRRGMRLRFGPHRCPSALESTLRACQVPGTEIGQAAFAELLPSGVPRHEPRLLRGARPVSGCHPVRARSQRPGRLAGVDWRSVKLGSLYVLIALAIDFVVDLPGLRRWSFWQIEQTANRSLGRVAVVHLTLVLGMFGAAMTDASALFGVFVVLKTLYSLSTALPQWEPATVPNWLGRAMNRLPNVHPGQRFEDVWATDRANEAERRERNEQPWTGARH
jgi:hypothetical protein